MLELHYRELLYPITSMLHTACNCCPFTTTMLVPGPEWWWLVVWDQYQPNPGPGSSPSLQCSDSFHQQLQCCYSHRLSSRSTRIFKQHSFRNWIKDCSINRQRLIRRNLEHFVKTSTILHLVGFCICFSFQVVLIFLSVAYLLQIVVYCSFIAFIFFLECPLCKTSLLFRVFFYHHILLLWAFVSKNLYYIRDSFDKLHDYVLVSFILTGSNMNQ